VGAATALLQGAAERGQAVVLGCGCFGRASLHQLAALTLADGLSSLGSEKLLHSAYSVHILTHRAGHFSFQDVEELPFDRIIYSVG
jgi:hypothetical protein